MTWGPSARAAVISPPPATIRPVVAWVDRLGAQLVGSWNALHAHTSPPGPTETLARVLNASTKSWDAQTIDAIGDPATSTNGPPDPCMSSASRRAATILLPNWQNDQSPAAFAATGVNEVEMLSHKLLVHAVSPSFWAST